MRLNPIASLSTPAARGGPRARRLQQRGSTGATGATGARGLFSSAQFFHIPVDTVSDVAFGGSPFVFSNNNPNNTGVTHVPGGDNFEVTADGIYLITLTVNFDNSNGATIAVVVNGNPPEPGASMVTIAASGSVTLQTLLALFAGDDIQVLNNGVVDLEMVDGVVGAMLNISKISELP